MRHGGHFYACAARTEHEINFRGAPYEPVPEYFVNSLLVLMTRPRRTCAFAQSHQGVAGIKFEVDKDSDHIKFYTSTYVVLYLLEYQFHTSSAVF